MKYTSKYILLYLKSSIIDAYEEIDNTMSDYERQRAFGYVDGLICAYEALWDVVYFGYVDTRDIEEAEKRCFERLSK